ncbi:hypothetical protein ACLOJK_037021, partial [Asimina triloba]
LGRRVTELLKEAADSSWSDGGAAGVDVVGCCRGRAELTEVADGGANRPCYCRWKTKMDRPIWDRWPSDLDLEGRSGEMGFNPSGFGRSCWRDARRFRPLGRGPADGFGKGVGSWAADDAGDAGSSVGAGRHRLDACVELLDLGRLVLVDRRWAARQWMEGRRIEGDADGLD